MPNPGRGEVDFEAAGQRWTLKISTGAMRHIERMAEMPMPRVGALLSSEETASITLMVTVFWGALQAHHPGTTIDEVDSLIDEIGAERAGQLIGEAFALAQPKGGGARPPKATAAR